MRQLVLMVFVSAGYLGISSPSALANLCEAQPSSDCQVACHMSVLKACAEGRAVLNAGARLTGEGGTVVEVPGEFASETRNPMVQTKDDRLSALSGWSDLGEKPDDVKLVATSVDYSGTFALRPNGIILTKLTATSTSGTRFQLTTAKLNPKFVNDRFPENDVLDFGKLQVFAQNCEISQISSAGVEFSTPCAVSFRTEHSPERIRQSPYRNSWLAYADFSTSATHLSPVYRANELLELSVGMNWKLALHSADGPTDPIRFESKLLKVYGGLTFEPQNVSAALRSLEVSRYIYCRPARYSTCDTLIDASNFRLNAGGTDAFPYQLQAISIGARPRDRHYSAYLAYSLHFKADEGDSSAQVDQWVSDTNVGYSGWQTWSQIDGVNLRMTYDNQAEKVATLMRQANTLRFPQLSKIVNWKEVSDPLRQQLLDANLRKEMSTIICRVYLNGQLENVKELLKLGARTKGMSGLTGVLRYGSVAAPIAALLIDHGTSPNAVDEMGNSAMTWMFQGAAKGSCMTYAETYSLLAEKGANLNLQNNPGDTALMILLREIETLRKATADRGSSEMRERLENLKALALEMAAEPTINLALRNRVGHTAFRYATLRTWGMDVFKFRK